MSQLVKLVFVALCAFSTVALAQKGPGSPAAVYSQANAQCARNNPSTGTDADGNPVASPARIACDAAALSAYYASLAAASLSQAPAAPAKK